MCYVLSVLVFRIVIDFVLTIAPVAVVATLSCCLLLQICDFCYAEFTRGGNDESTKLAGIIFCCHNSRSKDAAQIM